MSLEVKLTTPKTRGKLGFFIGKDQNFISLFLPLSKFRKEAVITNLFWVFHKRNNF